MKYNLVKYSTRELIILHVFLSPGRANCYLPKRKSLKEIQIIERNARVNAIDTELKLQFQNHPGLPRLREFPSVLDNRVFIKENSENRLAGLLTMHLLSDSNINEHSQVFFVSHRSYKTLR